MGVDHTGMLNFNIVGRFINISEVLVDRPVDVKCAVYVDRSFMTNNIILMHYKKLCH